LSDSNDDFEGVQREPACHGGLQARLQNDREGKFRFQASHQLGDVEVTAKQLASERSLAVERTVTAAIAQLGGFEPLSRPRGKIIGRGNDLRKQRFSPPRQRGNSHDISSKPRTKRLSPEPLLREDNCFAAAKVLQLLRDPLIMLMMQADHVSERSLLDLLDQVSRDLHKGQLRFGRPDRPQM
jgi:hypothetical protein